MPAGSRWYCFDPADSGTVGEPEWIPQGVTHERRRRHRWARGAARELVRRPHGTGQGRPRQLPRRGDEQVPPRAARLPVHRHRRAADVRDRRAARRAGSTPAGSSGTAICCTSWTRHAASACSTCARSSNSASPTRTRSAATATKYHGFGYRYVMPQVGAWVNAAGPDNDGDFTCEANGAPKFSSIGLDSGALITSEYCRLGRRLRARGALVAAARRGRSPPSDGGVPAAGAQRPGRGVRRRDVLPEPQPRRSDARPIDPGHAEWRHARGGHARGARVSGRRICRTGRAATRSGP